MTRLEYPQGQASVRIRNGAVCPVCNADQSGPSYLGQGLYKDFEFSYRGCLDCGSLFVAPMPDESVLQDLYSPDYLEMHYASDLGGETVDTEVGGELDEAVQLLVERKPGGTVLDVGCGAGRFLRMARMAGLCPEGHERQVVTAQTTSQVTRIKVHAGELANVHVRYDAVHIADVLEHCPSPLDMLIDIRRLLMPDGVLVARGPLENQMNIFQQSVRLSRLLKAKFGKLGPATLPPYHVILFTLTGWRRLFGRAGFRVLDERVYETRWPAPKNFSLRPVSVIKELSLLMSRSALGRSVGMGNRVRSLLAMK